MWSLDNSSGSKEIEESIQSYENDYREYYNSNNSWEMYNIN